MGTVSAEELVVNGYGVSAKDERFGDVQLQWGHNHVNILNATKLHFKKAKMVNICYVLTIKTNPTVL